MDPPERLLRRRRSRARARWGIAGGLVLALLAAAAIERVPIATRLVDRRLAAAGVPARYRLTGLSPTTQVIEDVTLGDPARPDLVARHVVLHWRYGWAGASLVGVEVDGVRLRADWRDGRLSLGTLDRLLPRAAGGGAALPDLRADVRDGAMTLLTSAGAIDLGLRGSGNLRRDFRSTATLRARALAMAGCVVDAPRGAVRIVVAAGAPHIVGRIATGLLACPTRALRLERGMIGIDARLAPTLDDGTARLSPTGFGGRIGAARIGGLGGTLTIDGRLAGAARLAVAGPVVPGARARGATVDGRYALAGAAPRFTGRIGLEGITLDRPARETIATIATAPAGTPLAPIGRALARRLGALAHDTDLAADLSLQGGATRGVTISRLIASTGGREAARLSGSIRANDAGWHAAATLAGAGLPRLSATASADQHGLRTADVRMVPYRAGDARLALAPVRIAVTRDGYRIATIATVDGPLGDGRVEGLMVPIAGAIRADGALRFGEGCVPVSFEQLRLSSVTFDPASLRICGAPIVARTGAGAFRIAAGSRAVTLTGRSGSAPLRLDAASARLTGAGFTLSGLSARLGRDPDPTRLTIATLAGAFAQGSIGGRFTDTAGAIAHVPLDLSGATGGWTLAGGRLHLTGALAVSDQAAAVRFRPLRSDDVALDLDGGRITAAGTLTEPTTRAVVAHVTLRHDLAGGRGDALLAVPGLTFARDGLQPELVTPLTLGVVANVAGTITGEGRIAWSPQATTSTGRFRTDRLDLAAAFGPVTGIAGEIAFTDLLGLVTAPGQRATIATINPGVLVADGVATYQLIGDNRVVVEGARWPFAGGELVLEPAALDFSAARERRLTFRIAGLDAGAFIQQLDFPNISATGSFDGRLPMVFDDMGGRIEGGTLASRGGGTLAYVGELSNAAIGTMGKLAFDALKAIRYSKLGITFDGRLDGEIVSVVRFDGVRQATGEGGLVARLIRNLPFRFNIAIRAPFRGLIGTARTYADPSLLLQSLRTPTAPPVQPSATAPVK